MKLQKPKGRLTQGFGENKNPYYKSVGLLGHTGEDYVNGWKSVINAVVDGEVYSTMNIGNPNTDAYRAIYQIVDDPEFSYEVSYGHIDKAIAEKGEFVRAGQPIATEGNWGTAYSNGILVNPVEKSTGKGSHLHFQVRKCIRVPRRKSGKRYLRHSNGYLKRGDKYYEVVDYDNGYRGCVDPKQFYQLTFAELMNLINLFNRLGIIKD